MNILNCIFISPFPPFVFFFFFFFFLNIPVYINLLIINVFIFSGSKGDLSEGKPV
jgi:hypothetical protein